MRHLRQSSSRRDYAPTRSATTWCTAIPQTRRRTAAELARARRTTCSPSTVLYARRERPPEVASASKHLLQVAALQSRPSRSSPRCQPSSRSSATRLQRSLRLSGRIPSTMRRSTAKSRGGTSSLERRRPSMAGFTWRMSPAGSSRTCKGGRTWARCSFLWAENQCWRYRSLWPTQGRCHFRLSSSHRSPSAAGRTSRDRSWA
mmetsp:Transcript_79970/g.212262  ORF Transcript_79970/g.212262 Transcript_79970/m.212262 type:complete len:203 (+) Transcript_79970:296-904(+)